MSAALASPFYICCWLLAVSCWQMPRAKGQKPKANLTIFDILGRYTREDNLKAGNLLLLLAFCHWLWAKGQEIRLPVSR